ncbi:hypothetical protein [Microbacterium sp.]
MNPSEQTLLFAATGVVLTGTLVVLVVQYVRRYGSRRRRDEGED